MQAPIGENNDEVDKQNTMCFCISEEWNNNREKKCHD